MPQTTALQQSYRLADHVRACHVDGQVILLDLRRDRYIGVGGALLPALSSRVADWPSVQVASTGEAPEADIGTWLASMCDQGMLTSTSTTVAHRVGIAEPQDSLVACDEAPGKGVHWRRIGNIALATLTAKQWLQRHRLAEIVEQVDKLRPAPPTDPAAAQNDQLRTAASWYLRTRPFVMSSHDECLRDSLTMLRFLAAEQLYPQWVIGVRTRPFGAHSWVQSGHLVLNDLHETVRAYTPILIV